MNRLLGYCLQVDAHILLSSINFPKFWVSDHSNESSQDKKWAPGFKLGKMYGIDQHCTETFSSSNEVCQPGGYVYINHLNIKLLGRTYMPGSVFITAIIT